NAPQCRQGWGRQPPVLPQWHPETNFMAFTLLPTIISPKAERGALARSALAGVTALGLTTALTPAVLAQEPSAQTSQAAPSHGPASVADLAEGLLDAVVNISTSQNVGRRGGGRVTPTPRPGLPEGSP